MILVSIIGEATERTRGRERERKNGFRLRRPKRAFRSPEAARPLPAGAPSMRSGLPFAHLWYGFHRRHCHSLASLPEIYALCFWLIGFPCEVLDYPIWCSFRSDLDCFWLFATFETLRLGDRNFVMLFLFGWVCCLITLSSLHTFTCSNSDTRSELQVARRRVYHRTICALLFVVFVFLACLFYSKNRFSWVCGVHGLDTGDGKNISHGVLKRILRNSWLSHGCWFSSSPNWGSTGWDLLKHKT